MKSTGSQAPTFGMVCEVLDPSDRVHMHQLADLDARCRKVSWTAAQYKEELTRPFTSCHGVTAGDGALVGYAIVRTSDLVVTITDILVATPQRRKGVGTMLIGCVRKGCITESRTCIEATVNDRNLDAHLFFKKLGFRGEMLHDESGDYYLFRWHKGKDQS